jgi:hypothetical protein
MASPTGCHSAYWVLADAPPAVVPDVVVLVVAVVPPADPALDPPLPAAGGDEPVSTR